MWSCCETEQPSNRTRKKKFIWSWTITEKTQVFVTESPWKIPSLTQHPTDMVHMSCRSTKLQGKWRKIKHEHCGSPSVFVSDGQEQSTAEEHSQGRENTGRRGHCPAEWAALTIIRNNSIARIRKTKSQSLPSPLILPISKQETNPTFYFVLKTHENKVLKSATSQRVQAICKISLQDHCSLSLQGPVSPPHLSFHLCNVPLESPNPAFEALQILSFALKSHYSASSHLNLLSDPALQTEHSQTLSHLTPRLGQLPSQNWILPPCKFRPQW